MTEEQKRLVEENMDLVPYVVNKFFNRHFDKDDLISIGNIGLIRAAKGYNSNKKIKFSTLAVTSIKNQILNSFAYKGRKRRTLQEGEKLLSLDYLYNTKDGKKFQLSEFIPDDLNVSDVVVNRVLVEKMLSVLNERERKYITLKYDKELMVKEIAEMEGIHVNTIWYVIHVALKKMRSEFKEVS